MPSQAKSQAKSHANSRKRRRRTRRRRRVGSGHYGGSSNEDKQETIFAGITEAKAEIRAMNAEDVMTEFSGLEFSKKDKEAEENYTFGTQSNRFKRIRKQVMTEAKLTAIEIKSLVDRFMIEIVDQANEFIEGNTGKANALRGSMTSTQIWKNIVEYTGGRKTDLETGDTFRMKCLLQQDKFITNLEKTYLGVTEATTKRLHLSKIKELPDDVIEKVASELTGAGTRASKKNKSKKKKKKKKTRKASGKAYWWRY